ncbi:MAG TPA: recombinase family protein [Thermoguttaceae bacterium]|nr:recombinase family protein [Thermoguttaceae bacterium]
MNRHIAVYLRVSSKKQDHRSQEPDLKRWAEAQDRPVQWYRDKATGRTMDRPAWNRLEAAIHAGQVFAVVVWRLDRLGRTCSGLTKLFEQLRERRMNLISLKDAIDLATASGRLLAHVLASVAQFENELRSERVRAGQAAARAAGKTWGGSKPGRRLTVTNEQVKTIRRLDKDGEGVTAIARATGLSRPTVYRILEH